MLKILIGGQPCIPKLCGLLNSARLGYREQAKIGMAVSLAVRKCGAAFPRYAPLVMPALLKGCKPPTAPPNTDRVELQEHRAGCVSCLTDVVTVSSSVLQSYAPVIFDLYVWIVLAFMYCIYVRLRTGP